MRYEDWPGLAGIEEIGGRRRKVESRCLVAGQQVRVAGERERGRVVAECATELEEIGPLARVKRGERVAERVSAPGARRDQRSVSLSRLIRHAAE